MRLDERLELDITYILNKMDTALMYRMLLIGWPTYVYIEADFNVEELPVQIYGKTLILTLII